LEAGQILLHGVFFLRRVRDVCSDVSMISFVINFVVHIFLSVILHQASRHQGPSSVTGHIADNYPESVVGGHGFIRVL